MTIPVTNPPPSITTFFQTYDWDRTGSAASARRAAANPIIAAIARLNFHPPSRTIKHLNQNRSQGDSGNQQHASRPATTRTQITGKPI
ncbi:MAG TPA: hypothetical protein VM008_04880 [Phycisphaerae bacterium]|nr:hypothetical protein [Phycisphaerae bacterium]